MSQTHARPTPPANSRLPTPAAAMTAGGYKLLWSQPR